MLSKEAHAVWKKGRGPVEKLDNTTGEIMCLVEVPASYKTVTKTVKTDDGRMEWRRIMCETNVTPDVVTRIQTTLHQAGYDPGPVDGILGRQTVAAVKSYQRDNRLAEGGLTYETVKKLGVSM